jgi:hypothetical protein
MMVDMVKRLLVLAVLVVLGVGLYLFQPWRLATTRTANDVLVVSAPMSSSAAPATAPVPVAVASGPFRSLEHETTGSATLVRLPEGGHVVQFEALDTSDGPDLYVYLSDKTSDSTESAFGSGFTSLGKLKGNQGNQVYDIPSQVDLKTVRSVVIWCQRFSAGFAVAPLEHP